MRSRWLAAVIGFAVLLSTAAFGSVVPTPAYPGAAASLAYKVSVDGQPVFVHRFPTVNQFRRRPPKYMEIRVKRVNRGWGMRVRISVAQRTASVPPRSCGFSETVGGFVDSFRSCSFRVLILRDTNTWNCDYCPDSRFRNARPSCSSCLARKLTIERHLDAPLICAHRPCLRAHKADRQQRECTVSAPAHPLD